MNEDELREIEKEEEEKQRFLRAFRWFLESDLSENLKNISQHLSIIAEYTRLGARALLWIAIIVIVFGIKYFFF